MPDNFDDLPEGAADAVRDFVDQFTEAMTTAEEDPLTRLEIENTIEQYSPLVDPMLEKAGVHTQDDNTYVPVSDVTRLLTQAFIYVNLMFGPEGTVVLQSALKPVTVYLEKANRSQV